MKVLIDRDSVCMGDDVQGHEETRVFDDAATVEQILEQVVRSRYLPGLDGERVSATSTPWSWVARSAGCAFSVLSNRWSSPRLLRASAGILATLAEAGELRIEFVYAWQRDPEALWDELRGASAR